MNAWSQKEINVYLLIFVSFASIIEGCVYFLPCSHFPTRPHLSHCHPLTTLTIGSFPKNIYLRASMLLKSEIFTLARLLKVVFRNTFCKQTFEATAGVFSITILVHLRHDGGMTSSANCNSSSPDHWGHRMQAKSLAWNRSLIHSDHIICSFTITGSLFWRLSIGEDWCLLSSTQQTVPIFVFSGRLFASTCSLQSCSLFFFRIWNFAFDAKLKVESKSFRPLVHIWQGQNICLIPWRFNFERYYRRSPNRGSKAVFSLRNADSLLFSLISSFFGPFNCPLLSDYAGLGNLSSFFCNFICRSL